MRKPLRTLQITVCAVTGLLSGCNAGVNVLASDAGPVSRGKAAIKVYGCGKCHTIPGIQDADGVVGPPLGSVAQRTYIAGNFPNTPDTLAHWIMSPQGMKPRTAMPSLGIAEPQARDIAAYLETLR